MFFHGFRLPFQGSLRLLDFPLQRQSGRFSLQPEHHFSPRVPPSMGSGGSLPPASCTSSADCREKATRLIIWRPHSIQNVTSLCLPPDSVRWAQEVNGSTLAIWLLWVSGAVGPVWVEGRGLSQSKGGWLAVLCTPRLSKKGKSCSGRYEVKQTTITKSYL